jgi:hypothetical protein
MNTRLKRFPLADGRIEITVEGLPNGEVSPYLLGFPISKEVSDDKLTGSVSCRRQSNGPRPLCILSRDKNTNRKGADQLNEVFSNAADCILPVIWNDICSGLLCANRSEGYEPLAMGRPSNWRLGFRYVPLRLSFLFPHRASDNTAKPKVLDRTPCCHCQQLYRLCDWIANVTVWFRSCKPVLHLRIRVQRTVLAKEANKPRSGAATD